MGVLLRGEYYSNSIYIHFLLMLLDDQGKSGCAKAFRGVVSG